MKNLEEIAKLLEMEIEEKQKTLRLIKTDKIMRNLKTTDVRISIVENGTTKKLYYQARPKVPYRNERASRLMSKSLGNIEKMTEEKFTQRRNDAIKLFKKKWLDMRNDFEILKNNS